MHTSIRAISSFLLVAGAVSLSGECYSGDPSIGGYYFFAALDRKCPEPTPARTAALEQLKRHFLANARRLIADYPPSQTAEASRLLEDLERNGPTDEDLAQFDSLLAKGTPKEIAELCRSAPAEIAQRIEIERKMSAAMEQIRAAREKSAVEPSTPK
jgi:hypothetical protein